MIQDNTLTEAIAEAERFIRTAKALKATRGKPGIPWSHSGRSGTYPVNQSREHAACKRSSMDLSRKLADLRADR